MTSENEDPKEPHPDKILEEVESILRRARAVSDAEQCVHLFVPYVATMGYILNQLKSTGFSQDAAEHMAFIVWTRLFEPDWGDDDFFGDDD